MSVEAIDFLDWAKQVVGDTNTLSEIEVRTCASRAYYASYHLALSVGQRIPGLEHGNSGVHQNLVEHLLTGPRPGEWALYDRELKELGYQLRQQKSIRHKADYRLGTDFDISEAHRSIQLSENIQSTVSQFSDSAA